VPYHRSNQPNLYVDDRTGIYVVRTKVQGHTIWKSLGTADYSVAKFRLAKALAELQKGKLARNAQTFGCPNVWRSSGWFRIIPRGQLARSVSPARNSHYPTLKSFLRSWDSLNPRAPGARRTPRTLFASWLIPVAVSQKRPTSNWSTSTWWPAPYGFWEIPSWVPRAARPGVFQSISRCANSVYDSWIVSVHQTYLLKLTECRKALASACAKAGVPRIGHHDCRHMFTTRAIEAEIPIPTVARWLGHKDGGALLMRTYSHLLDAYSKAMAARMKF
jgi:Phage integrase family